MVDPAAAIQRLRSALIKYRMGLYKKKVSKKAEKPKEIKERKPLPPEAKLVEGANLEEMEKAPPVIPVEKLLA
jgi:succinate dehydrogenase / fumarate reductase iron-sulfur subunit